MQSSRLQRGSCRSCGQQLPRPLPWAIGWIAGVVLQCHPLPALAHIPLDQFNPSKPSLGDITAGFDPAAAVDRGANAMAQPPPTSSRTRRATTTSSSSRSSPVESSSSPQPGSNSSSRPAPRRQSRGQAALEQLQRVQAVAAAGDWPQALSEYDTFLSQYDDLALAEYARLGKALALYQVGQTSNALLLLEDQEVAMRGNPEVHAALAAVLYAERPAQRWRAEQQFDIALEFDARYEDVSWVTAEKHWPPQMVAALRAFLQLI